jgi:hypothetical protein
MPITYDDKEDVREVFLPRKNTITAADLNEIKEVVNNLELNNVGIVYATYAELQSLVLASELIVGWVYVLTDYQTIYDQPDFDSGGSLKETLVLKTETTEPLILTAASDSTFSNTVISTIYPKDRIQYDFTIDETYVSNSPCKGRITERIDEWNNRTDYDHRTVKFIRYESSTGSGVYNVVNDNGEDSQEFLTFGTGCFSNYIGDVWVFVNDTGDEFPNFVMGDNCFSNKIGDSCTNNTWGNSNGNNTWGNSNSNNTWGNSNFNNTWGELNSNNTWGNSNFNNTWGNSNGNNTWGNSNSNNTLTNNITSLDFTSATHTVQTYGCEIFIASDNNFYLKYFDGTQYQFVSPTS